jgi:murein DD-endopeptidase MepM/ murein hydrolase activator NlpD
MPRYSKSQLDGFVADRRYWDKKHPEHKAHLDFTVKAFEDSYPDPLMPTKEQEDWAAQEEKRLREMAKLRPFRDKSDPGHADARASFHRGFDKINAVLYGAQAPEPEADEPAPAKAPDPLDPATFARMASTRTPPAPNPPDFAAQRAQAQAPAQPAPAREFESAEDRMSLRQHNRNVTTGDRRSPADGNPNRTVWQAESEDAGRAAEAARQLAIQQENDPRRALSPEQKRLQNRAPEDWDRERSMPQIANPIPGAPIRARDPRGGGHFGAGRGGRPHYGVDIEAAPGTAVMAPVSGTIQKVDIEPYRSGDHRGRYRGMRIRTDDGDLVTIFYLNRDAGLRQGMRVDRGRTQLGTAQDLHQSYPADMTNHIHLEMQRMHPVPPREGEDRTPDPIPQYVDPTPYIRSR